jgi:hypothetical protein
VWGLCLWVASMVAPDCGVNGMTRPPRPPCPSDWANSSAGGRVIPIDVTRPPYQGDPVRRSPFNLPVAKPQDINHDRAH